MNVRRGLLRLWIVVSLCWAVPAAWLNRDELIATRHWTRDDLDPAANGFKLSQIVTLRPDWQTRVPAAVLVAARPIVLLLVVLGMGWVGKGFGISISAKTLLGWWKR